MAKQKIKVIREEMLQVANNVAQEKNINFIFDQNANSRSAIELMENDTIDIGDVIYNYQSQIEYALTWRSIAIETYEKFNKKEVLTAADLNYLNYAIEQYRKMREPLFQIISRYAPYTNKNVSIKINDKKPTQYSTKKSLWNKSIKEVTISLKRSALCSMALENVLASLESSKAPSKRVSELALITLTGVLSSWDRFDTKSLRIESISLN